MSIEKENISLMMVTYNRLDLTKKTIAGLKKSVNLPCNLIIVDNGSVDDTFNYLLNISEECSKPFKKIHLSFLDENKGIAIGRNIALKIADNLDTKWYCTIDNDVEMPWGWLEECIKILKLNKEYGAIGVNMEGKEYPIVNKNNCIFQNKPQGNLGTACMVFRKQLHSAIGFFREYNKYGLEDSDFGMRARFFGYKLGYIKKKGTHLGVGEFDSGEYRKFKTYEHDSRVKEFQKNCSLYAQRKLPLYISYKEVI